ncbi:hypothetical protein Tco_1296256, partial [Tanacetum coccineum]
LARIGLFKSPDPDDHISGGAVSYVLILDGASPSLQPVPIHVVTAAIKDKVNIVRSILLPSKSLLSSDVSSLVPNSRD